jgi:hexokinase
MFIVYQLINYCLNRFEKMISGYYLGELVRSVVADLTRKNLLFSGKGSEKLFTPHCFKTTFVSWIESDKKDEFIQTRKALNEMDLSHATKEGKYY